MQQNLYYNKPSLFWFYDIKNSFFKNNVLNILIINIAFLVLTFLLIVLKENILFIHLNFVLYLFCLLCLIFETFSFKLKKKIVYTKRVIRLCVTCGILFLIFNFLMLILAFKISLLFILLIFAFNVFWGIIVILSNLVNFPLEWLIKQKYILKAKKKLKSYKNLIVIGITGSYGKTSTKNFLYEMLKSKYNVLCSPKSYNTPMGITRTILEKLKPFHEILILEMGADHNHDINKICKIVKPNISIITSVGNQHLKTFKTINNIINTKFEIVKNTKKNGFFVTNTINEICLNYFKNSPIKCFNVDKNYNAYLKIINIFANENGLNFEIEMENNTFEFKTNLLGKFNVYNICLSIIVAYKLGVALNDLKNIVENLKPVEHRLCVKQLKNGITLIDDSFNSNLVGACEAVESLMLFKNKHKIIITCGMVELGEKQFEENFNFGKSLKDVDEVIVVNTTNFKAISEGLISVCNKKPKLFKNFNSAFEYVNTLNKNLVVLIENDLPDAYIFD